MRTTLHRKLIMPSNKYTYRDVVSSYNTSKSDDERRGEWVARYIYRPMSFPLTTPLLNMGLHAKYITYAGMLASLSLPVIAYTGYAHSYTAILLVALAVLILIMDCIDGNIARTAGQYSEFGAFMDMFGDLLYRGCLYLAIGILAHYTTVQYDWLQTHAISICLLSLWLTSIARISREYIHNRQPATATTIVSSHPYLSPLVSFVSGLDHLLPWFMLIASFLDKLHYLLFWLLFYSMLDLLNTISTALNKLR